MRLEPRGNTSYRRDRDPTTVSILYLKTQGGWQERTGIVHSGETRISHEGSGAAALKTVLDGIAARRAALAPPDPET